MIISQVSYRTNGPLVIVITSERIIIEKGITAKVKSDY